MCMTINIKQNEFDDYESIKINGITYDCNDEDEIYVSREDLINENTINFPIGVYINIFDKWEDGHIQYRTIPFSICHMGDSIYKICFDETNTRKYWYSSIGLETWIKIRHNILEKIFLCVIQHYDDDGAYIQFNYSTTFNVATFKMLFERIDDMQNRLDMATEIAATSPNILLDYSFYKELNSLRNMWLKDCNEDSWQFEVYKKELSQIIERHLRENNPDKLLLEYRTLLLTKEFRKKTIKVGEKFYRGRIGMDTIKGAIDDCNQEFSIPYNGEGIGVAPALYTSGGRFNRAGTSYIYLATDVETCLAEVHLQVGQVCSVGEFECVADMELINLSDTAEDLELKAWYEIITQPVHDAIKHKYLITQFMSEVLMQFNSDGLYFKSVQSDGNNIVCFQPNKFRLVKYSEKLYRADKIKYSITQHEDTIRKYANRNDSHLLNSYNSDDDERNQEKFENMMDWIEYEKQRNN